METKLKEIVSAALEAKLGHPAEITREEWEAAKIEVWNDVFYNKVCYLHEPTLDYIIYTMVAFLIIMKKAAA